MIRPLLFLALLAIPAQAADAPPASIQANGPAITVAAATTRELVETAVVTGTLVARDEIMVGTEIDGLPGQHDFLDRGIALRQFDQVRFDLQPALDLLEQLVGRDTECARQAGAHSGRGGRSPPAAS